MITQLTIQNFGLIDRLSLEFGEGLNVLTGETGAGKSIIIDAVGLLLGAKPEATGVRAGCDRALIEGVFELPPSTELRDLLPRPLRTGTIPDSQVCSRSGPSPLSWEHRRP